MLRKKIPYRLTSIDTKNGDTPVSTNVSPDMWSVGVEGEAVKEAKRKISADVAVKKIDADVQQQQRVSICVNMFSDPLEWN